MEIFDSISEICGIDGGVGEKDFTISCIGNAGLVFEGKYKIEIFDQDKICLNLGKGRFISILGKSLSIGSLAPKELGVSGKIENILFEGKF